MDVSVVPHRELYILGGVAEPVNMARQGKAWNDGQIPKSPWTECFTFLAFCLPKIFFHVVVKVKRMAKKET